MIKQKYNKYTKAELAYFSKPISKATVDYDWLWWLAIGVISLTGIAYWAWTVMK